MQEVGSSTGHVSKAFSCSDSEQQAIDKLRKPLGGEWVLDARTRGPLYRRAGRRWPIGLMLASCI